MGKVLNFTAGFAVALLVMGGVRCARDKYGGVSEEEVVAMVGARVLTAADLDELDSLQRMKKTPKYLTKEELMDEWVRSEVIYQEGIRRNLNKDPEVEKVLINTEKSVLIRMFWQKYVYDVYPEPDDEGALEYYEEVKDRDYKAEVELYWLRELAAAKPDELETVRKTLADGKDFESVVRAHSMLPTKLNGGNMGYVKLSSVPPKAREAILSAEAGDTVGPLDMGQFTYYYKIEDHILPGGYLKPEALGIEYLRDKAKVANWVEEAGRLGEDLYERADIETHPENINDTAVDMLEGAPGPIKKEH